METTQKYVTVLVLGDVGRSPRMQYHCLSLADNGFEVSLIGYKGKNCCDEVETNKHITKYLVNGDVFKGLPRYLFPLYAPLKVLYQFFMFFYMLLFVLPKPMFYLVQNPPSIPSLFLVWIVSRIQKCKFVVDWHNLGYTILALSMGQNNLLTKIYKYLEYYFGTKADYNLCVTQSMQKWLLTNWNIQASVLYDKPPNHYHQLSLIEKHNFYKHLESILDFSDLPIYASIQNDLKETLITETIQNTIQYRKNRPLVLVSSTSWTPDEDFGIFFDALIQMDEQLYIYENSNKNQMIPNIICIITGSGPLKEHYELLFKQAHFHYVHIYTVWLSFSDYASLLGSSDLGISLHTSSSGLDLPMKVVDMFGASLPVCAKSFPALPELVKDSYNGFVFETSDDLCQLLVKITKNYIQENNILPTLREGVQTFLEDRWKDNWNRNARPIFINEYKNE